MIYIVLTEEGRLGPNIWSEILQPAESIKNIIRIAWNTKAMRWQNDSRTLDSLLSFISREARHVGAVIICDSCQQNS